MGELQARPLEHAFDKLFHTRNPREAIWTLWLDKGGPGQGNGPWS
jgi:hypothetical protein